MVFLPLAVRPTRKASRDLLWRSENRKTPRTLGISGKITKLVHFFCSCWLAWWLFLFRHGKKTLTTKVPKNFCSTDSITKQCVLNVGHFQMPVDQAIAHQGQPDEAAGFLTLHGGKEGTSNNWIWGFSWILISSQGLVFLCDLIWSYHASASLTMLGLFAIDFMIEFHVFTSWCD